MEQSTKMPPEHSANATKNPLGSSLSQVCDRNTEGVPMFPETSNRREKPQMIFWLGYFLMEAL